MIAEKTPFIRPKFVSSSARNRSPRLSREKAERQGHIVRLTHALLGGRDEAIAFLNTYNTQLGARPLDLAMSDPAGYAAVARALHQLAPSIGALQ